MMRTFKFRAWDNEFEMMFYSNSSDDPLNVTGERIHHLCGCEKPEGHLNYFFFKKAPIMQFTGLHDKHGKEIYEGDIIRGNGNNLFAIIPMLGGLSICNTHYLGQKHNELISEPTNDAQSAQWLKESEVIGNVYENPDLLKGE
jgi:uncharacterized phage protein (TIGR01671 family)